MVSRLCCRASASTTSAGVCRSVRCTPQGCPAAGPPPGECRPLRQTRRVARAGTAEAGRAAPGRGPGGRPGRRRSGPGQRDMVLAVDTALRTAEHLLVQAGTGTGKSVGYLVPALAAGKRVVVATATKALQAQLVDKDLPAARGRARARALGRTPTYALAKGRGNYVCLQQVARRAGRGRARAGGAVRRAGADQRARPARCCGCASGRRPPTPATATTSPSRSATSPGGRCRCRPATASAAAAPTGPTASASGRGRRPRRPTSSSPTTRCSPSTPSPPRRCCPSTTPWCSTRPTSSSRPPPTRSPTSCPTASCAGRSRPPTGCSAPTVLARVEDAQGGVEGLLATTPVGLVEGLPPYALEVLAGVEGAFGAAAPARPGARPEGEDELEKARRDRAKAALAAVAETAAELRAPSRAVGASTRCRPAARRRCGSRRCRSAARSTPGCSASARWSRRRRDPARSAARSGTPPASSACRGSAAGPSATARPTTPATPRPRTRCSTRDRWRQGPVRWRHLDVGSPFDHGRQAPAVGRRPTCPTRAGCRSRGRARSTSCSSSWSQAAGGRTLGLFSSHGRGRPGGRQRARRHRPAGAAAGGGLGGRARAPVRLRRPHLPVRHPLVLAGRRRPRPGLPARRASTASRSPTSTTRWSRPGWPTPARTASRT